MLPYFDKFYMAKFLPCLYKTYILHSILNNLIDEKFIILDIKLMIIS